MYKGCPKSTGTPPFTLNGLLYFLQTYFDIFFIQSFIHRSTLKGSIPNFIIYRIQIIYRKLLVKKFLSIHSTHLLYSHLIYQILSESYNALGKLILLTIITLDGGFDRICKSLLVTFMQQPINVRLQLYKIALLVTYKAQLG